MCNFLVFVNLPWVSNHEPFLLSAHFLEFTTIKRGKISPLGTGEGRGLIWQNNLGSLLVERVRYKFLDERMRLIFKLRTLSILGLTGDR